MINITFERVVLVKEKTARYELERKVNSPDRVAKIANKILHLEDAAQEIFGIICVNTKNNIVGIHEVSRGTLNASIISPREVFKTALLHNASSIIAFHNHPSGDTSPSKEDLSVTKSLMEAGKLIDISVLDHVIIGDNSFLSLRESNLMS